MMAADLDTTPTPGLRAQLCGDAHLSNFGAYASPERRLVFDVNDFDETLPGPFEWDVKRLAASLVVAGRENGFTRKQCRKTSLAAVASYREAMRAFATQTILAVWYAHLDVDDAVAEFTSTLSARKRKKDKADLKATQRWAAKAHTRDSLQAIDKLTTVNGARRIISNPPLVVPIEELTEFDQHELLGRISDLLATYRGTLQNDREHLINHFTLADVAHKVVGVGSVGMRAWILLLEAGKAEALLLQAKQAERSALADYVGEPDYANQGERVVTGQRLMQASSDIFLGWLSARPTGDQDQDYYMRQLRDWKMSAVIEDMSPRAHPRVRQDLWLDARPRPRPFRRSHRDRGIPRQLGHVRQRTRLLRGDVRRPERKRPRRARSRRRCRKGRGTDRDLIQSSCSNVSTTLPALRPPSTRRCASTICVSGRIESITGASAPCSASDMRVR